MEKSTRSLRKIAAHYLYTPHGFLKNGILSIDQSGRIAAVETNDRVDSLAGVEFYSGILIPGIVNAHCHLELSHLHEITPPVRGLTAFIRAIGPLRKTSSAEERKAAIGYQIARMRNEGIVAVADTCNGPSSFPIKQKGPIYVHNFLELFGLRTTSIDPLRHSIEQCKNLDLPFSVTPHSTYSLNREAFAKAAEYAGKERTDTPLSIHFMESPEERELFQDRGALLEWFRECHLPADFAEEDSPAQRILQTIPRDRNLMLIHGTFATEKEIIALQQHFGDHLTWVLCPRSNARITGGKPPVELLRRHGAQIALGTDSTASSPTLSILEEMKVLAENPLEELLQWATLNGARALGIDSWCGSLEIGKRPGVALLEGVDLTHRRLTLHTTIRRLV